MRTAEPLLPYRPAALTDRQAGRPTGHGSTAPRGMRVPAPGAQGAAAGAGRRRCVHAPMGRLAGHPGIRGARLRPLLARHASGGAGRSRCASRRGAGVPPSPAASAARGSGDPGGGRRLPPRPPPAADLAGVAMCRTGIRRWSGTVARYRRGRPPHSPASRTSSPEPRTHSFVAGSSSTTRPRRSDGFPHRCPRPRAPGGWVTRWRR
jgi:hypothetical protein